MEGGSILCFQNIAAKVPQYHIGLQDRGIVIVGQHRKRHYDLITTKVILNR